MLGETQQDQHHVSNKTKIEDTQDTQRRYTKQRGV